VFRATNAKKTIKKFAYTYLEFIKKYGKHAVEEKLLFQLITNQPICESLIEAINALAKSAPQVGDVKKQAEQVAAASNLSGEALAAFAGKLDLIGRTGNLVNAKYVLENLFVDWSATNDAIAAARLGHLRNLVRDKAGYAGTDNNLITRPDVLAAMQIDDQKELLPCRSALVDVGVVLERQQLREAINRINDAKSPLLIHAAGGVGKTVFMSTLAQNIRSDYEVIFFDCFGGGGTALQRMLDICRKGASFISLIRWLFAAFAIQSSPNSPDLPTLLKTFRRRLKQSLETIVRVDTSRGLALFIDAIDNAEIAAQLCNEDCFPIKLLESLDNEPVQGVKIVVSCRTERKPKTYLKCHELEWSHYFWLCCVM